jgi:hypothetical protein
MPNRDSRIRLILLVDPRAITDISYHDILKKPIEFGAYKMLSPKQRPGVGWHLYRITIFLATAENSRAI